MTTIQGLVINDSGFIEKVAHSGSVTPTSFTGQSPKVRWDESEPDVIMNLNVDTTRASTLPTRSSRSRIANKRSRPYRDTASRPNSNQRTAPCRFFQAGKCTAGDSCRYRHVGRSTSPESDLDQQLQAFVKRDDDDSPALSKSTSKITYNPDDFPDEEELYEVVPNPSSTISEVRFNTRSNPGEIRTYFVVQRQTVVEYEGNNVGILSGGVLLGVPNSSSSVPRTKVEESPEDISESEMASSPASSLASNDSDHEQWKGPVSFEHSASTEAESLIWADDDGDDIPMDMVNSEFNTYNMASTSELPSPPPIIRRIIRQVDSHNRRHSLS